MALRLGNGCGRRCTGMQIRWQDDAINDLLQIRRFIAIDNPAAASQVADRIRSAVPNLTDQPTMGRPGRVPGTRELVLVDVPYIIVYRAEGNSVVILRILHTSRKWPDAMR